MKSYEECCEKCQEQNPFFKLGGGVVGKFAYPRKTPFIQPFESIESPWTDFIKSDSLETNIKKFYKLAQKYSKSQTEKDKKSEEEEEREKEEEVKSKPAPRPEQKPSAKGKEKVIAIDDDEEASTETQGALTRAQLEVFQSRWKSLNAQNKLSFIEKQEILMMAGRMGVLTETTNRRFQNVDRNLYKNLNERFSTNFSLKKTGIRMKR